MVDIDLASKLYDRGFSLTEIGQKFGVSRQRIWQKLKLIHERKGPITKVVALSSSEKLFMKKALSKKLTVIPQTYNAPFDFLVNNKKIEVKFCSTSTEKRYGKYMYSRWSFSGLKNSVKVDFHVFICGKSLPLFFIVPSEKVISNSTMTIPFVAKTKRSKRFVKNYLENWSSLM